LSERLLTADEVAEWLRVSRQWVYDHTSGKRRPSLPYVSLGKRKMFRRADVEGFIDQCAKQAA
jgi:excisionase family DNA binding protein